MRRSRLVPLLLLAALPGCASDDLLPDSTCPSPAPLMGTTDARAPGHIVIFHEGTDAAAATAALKSKYQFEVKFVYSNALPGFAANLNPVQLDGVRCEPRVKYVEHDGAVQLGI